MGCVSTLVDAHAARGWAALSLQQMGAWAAAHRLRLVVAPYVNSTWEIVENVRALLHARVADDDGSSTPLCDSVLHLDADAFVANLSWYPRVDARTDVLFASAAPVAPPTTLSPPPPHLLPIRLNTGVFWVRNTPEVRAFVSMWARRGDGRCDLRAQWPEQACAEQLHALLPHLQPALARRVEVVACYEFNQPLKFNTSSRWSLARQMRDCCASRAVCHPSGIHFWCKHFHDKGESLEQCTRDVRQLLHRACVETLQLSH